MLKCFQREEKMYKNKWCMQGTNVWLDHTVQSGSGLFGSVAAFETVARSLAVISQNTVHNIFNEKWAQIYCRLKVKTFTCTMKKDKDSRESKGC